jgi:hypothetical protein
MVVFLLHTETVTGSNPVITTTQLTSGVGTNFAEATTFVSNRSGINTSGLLQILSGVNVLSATQLGTGPYGLWEFL